MATVGKVSESQFGLDTPTPKTWPIYGFMKSNFELNFALQIQILSPLGQD